MNKRRSRFAPALSVANEILESRLVMSTGTIQPGVAEVAARSVSSGPTQTKLTASAGTLGQPITFTVTVRAPAAAGSPAGTVDLVDLGRVIQTLTLTPTTSTSPRFAYSQATYSLTPQPGGASPYYFGRHAINAVFTPSSGFTRSSGSTIFTVSQPAYTSLAGGVKVATIVPGSGTGIQSGQTASVLYTGYLAKNGQIFDDSLSHGGAPFSFTLGAGQVVPGFDAGTVGMKVGETRIVEIPAAEAYGRTATGSIPPNSTLVFVLTLQSIS